MKVRIPKTIKLLTHTSSIKFDNKFVQAQGTCGITRHWYQDIILDPCLPESEIAQVFFHEVFHVIERHFCVKLDDADIERLSEGLMEILVNNLGIEFDFSDIPNHHI